MAERPISEIARELSYVFKDAREDAWVKVAEHAQRLLVPEVSLLDRTQVEIAQVAGQIQTLQAITSLEFARLSTKPHLDYCGLRAISLMARLRTLQTWTPEKAEAAGLPWIGTKVFVDRGRLREGGVSGIYEVWALCEPGERDALYRYDVAVFTVLAPVARAFSHESQPLTAKDRGSWWKYPVTEKEEQ